MVNRRAKKDEFRLALRSRDPYALATILSIPRIAETKLEEPQIPGPREQLEENGNDWSAVLSSWLDAYEAAEAGYAIKCYESQSLLHSSFNHLFSSSQGNLLVPALHTVCKTTHRVASAADEESGTRDHARMEKAATLLQESFSRTINDRRELRPEAPFDEEGSKKAGVLLIVNELFSIYFQLNTLRLCKNLLRPVEGKKLHEQGMMGQMVTYRYYVGRINLFEDRYGDAEANLEYAFQNCHPNALHNKKCILRYLVPVKLYRGRLPSAAST